MAVNRWTSGEALTVSTSTFSPCAHGPGSIGEIPQLEMTTDADGIFQWVEVEPSETSLLPVNPDRGRDAGLYSLYHIYIIYQLNQRNNKEYQTKVDKKCIKTY